MEQIKNIKLKDNFVLAIFLLLFFATPLKGNNNRERNKQIESIESALRLVESSIKPRNTMLTIDEAKGALKLAEDIKYHRGIIKAHYIIALTYFYAADYKQSMSYVVKIEHLKDINKHIQYLAQMYYLKGRIYYITGLHEFSRQELDLALEYAFKINNENNKNLILANIYAAFARTYEHADNYKDIELFNNYLELSHKAHLRISDDFDYIPLPEFFIMKIEKFIRENKTDSASYYVQKLKELSLNNRFMGLPQAYSTLGKYYLHIQEPDSAFNYLTYAQERTEQSGVVYHLPHLYTGFSNYYTLMGDSDKALYYEDLRVNEENKQVVAKRTAGEEVVRIVLEDSHSHIHNRIFKTIGIISVSVAMTSYLAVRLYSKRKKNKLHIECGEKVAKMKRKSDASLVDIIEMAKSNNPAFMAHFQESFSEFWNKLIKTHTDLSPAEKHLCAMTYLNFTSKQIADYSGIQPASVYTRRSRLRKKINLNSDIDLFEYLSNL